jgi:hypothetical protein
MEDRQDTFFEFQPEAHNDERKQRRRHPLANSDLGDFEPAVAEG